MAGNTVKLNDYKEWYVGDSRIAELESWLHENAESYDEELDVIRSTWEEVRSELCALLEIVGDEWDGSQKKIIENIQEFLLIVWDSLEELNPGRNILVEGIADKHYLTDNELECLFESYDRVKRELESEARINFQKNKEAAEDLIKTAKERSKNVPCNVPCCGGDLPECCMTSSKNIPIKFEDD